VCGSDCVVVSKILASVVSAFGSSLDLVSSVRFCQGFSTKLMNTNYCMLCGRVLGRCCARSSSCLVKNKLFDMREEKKKKQVILIGGLAVEG
jgi:hypothetical protein